MKDLLVGPWQRSANDRPSEFPSYLVVIDALDEIENQGGSVFLRELLMTVNGGQLQGLKFLITSRPHPELASLCATFSSDVVCRLYEVPTDTVKADIVVYLKDKLPNLRDEPQLNDLAQKADGLFIYAATVVRYITPRSMMAKGEQVHLMGKLFGSTWAMSSMTASLIDVLYQQILQEAFSNLENELFHSRLSILHTFLCTEERVSPSIAAALISDTGMKEQASIVVRELHAVLHTIEGRVFWYHASFPDFIFTETRSKFTISGNIVNMSCDVAAHNTVVTRRCFNIMMSNLRFNICNLPSSFLLDSEVPALAHLVQKNVSDILTYCCRHWSQHLARVASNDRDFLPYIQDFFPMHVLFWIEVMNILQSSLQCPSMLQQAREWVLSVRQNNVSSMYAKLISMNQGDEFPTDLARDIAETSNFATYFSASRAAQSTPHLYISSLMTWSGDSVISQTWKKHFSRAPSITYTNIGNTMVVPLMNIQTGQTVSAVAFSHNGTYIVSGSYDKSVRVWDAWTGKELKTLNGHTDIVTSVAFSSDGTRIVSGSDDWSVRVWDASTGKVLRVLNGHTDKVKSVAFSNDGTRIVSGSYDRSIRVWDTWTGKELKILNGHTSHVRCVAFSGDATHIVSGSYDKSVRVWNAWTGEAKTLKGHTSFVTSVAFSSDGTRIVSGSFDESVRVWDALTGKELKTLNGHIDIVGSVAFSSDGTCIISGSDDQSVHVWDAWTGGELKRLIGHTQHVISVAFSSDGTRIVSGSADQSVRVWDASTGKELKTLNGHTDNVTSVAFSSDGTRIVSGSDDLSVRIWDASMGKELKTLNGHTSSVRSVAFSNEGTRIVSSSDDQSVRLWDALTGNKLKTLNGHTDVVTSVAFSRDGTCIVSGSYDNSVRVWDAWTGTELKALNGHTDTVFSVAFSSDSTHIVSGSYDQSVQIWDTSTGKELKTLNGHTSSVRSVAFSGDDTRIVSGSPDRSVRVWDASTGKELKTFNGHMDSVSSVAFSSDGTHIVSGSFDNSVRVWDLDYDGLHFISTPQHWIESLPYHDRLMWVPPEICGVLHYPPNLVICRAGSAAVEFAHSRIGTAWAECYTV
jgi:WD40 repeat protein